MSWHGVGDMNRVGGRVCMHRICIVGIPQSSLLPTIQRRIGEGGGGGAVEDFEKF